MNKLGIFAVILGVTLGLMMPTGQSRAPSVQAAAAVTRSSTPVETRIRRSENGHFYVHGMVNGQLVRFLVDTGATGVALTATDAERTGVSFSPRNFEVVGTGASGAVRGQVVRLDSVDVDGKVASNVPAAVLEGLEISLLGQSYLSQLASVEMSGDYMVLR